MFTIAFAGSSLCKWFQDVVLPLDPALEAVFARKPIKTCKRCGRRTAKHVPYPPAKPPPPRGCESTVGGM
jgi:hypothetical protein